MADNSVEAIRSELRRLRADVGSVGPAEGIRVQDRWGGVATLAVSVHERDFLVADPAEEILTRLRALPDDVGPEGVRSEFYWR